ncbi:MAG: hypothetical protein U1F20_03870 [Lysobacterales bacterium]
MIERLFQQFDEMQQLHRALVADRCGTARRWSPGSGSAPFHSGSPRPRRPVERAHHAFDDVVDGGEGGCGGRG